MFLDISEVAKQSGLPASTLRYYEEKGLIHSIGRRGLRRLFERQVLDTLDAISLARWAGFSLDEIRDWISPEGEIRIDRQRLEARADEIENLATRLMSLAQMVRHTAHCPQADHFSCPEFQRMLKVARRRKPARAMPEAPR
ncbi:helix-turn-helix domain-containing protein [Celeribacter neptunius]|uniref:DNA-binding transcriptional regulator, MerR family n=1 Tax=Celeribacter neptunius TaxID=588602 RepID=A0A1I3LA95_9RHOB|nr:helix-turn-helix domain-containing protein [Celeribacter neptunius]SFI81657.1 DNA-binding transcriptional regulator, MerR family [Celeribacter neptunius]